MAVVPARKLSRDAHRQRIHRRMRQTLVGSEGRPRLCVFRSIKHIRVQVIDDLKGHTVAAASSLDADVKKQIQGGGNIASAKIVGRLIAERAKAAGVESVVFDRGGYQYHGRIQALADAAREAGLKF